MFVGSRPFFILHFSFFIKQQWQRLEVFQVTFRVIVEDDAWIEQSQRVKQAFDLFHEAESLVSPFVAHVGSHVASGAVFGLQRAVVFVYHQVFDVFHQVGVALDFAVGGEALVEDEVIVPFQGMSVDAGVVVAVAGNELLQVCGGFGQVVNVERHVFDEAGRAGPACAAHRGEDARAYGPVLAIFLRFVGEAHGDVGVERCEACLYPCNVLRQFLRRTGFGFGEYGGQPRRVGSFLFILYIYRVVYGRQALVVQQFGSLYQPFALLVHQFLHGHHRAAGLFDVGEVEHRTGLVRVVVLCLHGHLGQERQCSFAAHHQVCDDVERVVETDKGQQVQSGDVFDGVFITDAFAQLFVGTDGVAQRAETLQELAVGHFERSTADGIARVEHRSVCQYDAG